LKRIVFTLRRTAHVVAASIMLELALGLRRGRARSDPGPYVGEWVYAAAGVIVIGSLPVLSLNVARVARCEWRRQLDPASLPSARRVPEQGGQGRNTDRPLSSAAESAGDAPRKSRHLQTIRTLRLRGHLTDAGRLGPGEEQLPRVRFLRRPSQLGRGMGIPLRA
jgi:hypothetical protein